MRPPFYSRRNPSPHCRSLVAGALALWMLLLALGIPLPAIPRLAAVDREAVTERFPCESCACGCSTAAYCWTKCCCHTMAGRLAWARNEGVRPPLTVLRQAAQAGHDVSDWLPGLRIAVVAPAAEAELSELPSCCQARWASKPACCEAPSSSKVAEQKTESDQVSLLQALACQGLLKQWLSCSIATLPVKFDLQFSVDLTWEWSLWLPRGESRSDSPNAPPPDGLLAVTLWPLQSAG